MTKKQKLYKKLGIKNYQEMARKLNKLLIKKHLTYTEQDLCNILIKDLMKRDDK